MDQYSNNSQNDFLWSLLDNPANDAQLYANNLQRLVNDFPQSGVLQALLAHASEEKNLKQASVYFNPRALFKLINAPSTFVGVPEERIFIQKGIGAAESYRFDQYPPVYNEPLIESPADTIDNDNELHLDRNAPVIEAAEAETTDHFTEHEPVFNHETDHYHAAPVEQNPEGHHGIESLLANDGAHAESEIAEATGHENEIPEIHQLAEDMPAGIEEVVVPELHEEEIPAIHDEAGEMHVENNEGIADDEEVAEAHHTTIEETPFESDGPVEDVAEETNPPEIHHLTDQIHSEAHEPAEAIATEETELPESHQVTEEAPADHHKAVEAIHETELPETHQVTEETPTEYHQAVEAVNETGWPEAHHLTEEVSAEHQEVPETEHETALPEDHQITEEVPAEHHEVPEAVHETEGSPVHLVTEEVYAEHHEIAHTEEHETEAHHHVSEPEVAVGEVKERFFEESLPELEQLVVPEAIKEAEIDKPTPSIDDAEEHKIPEIVAEIPVKEEVRPEPEIGEDETYDEIVGIEDIKFDKHSTGDNFFSFDQEFGAHEDEETYRSVEAAAGANGAARETDNQDVSKYHDEKMPYTFMWWLDKTRKEHSQAYQPYIKPQTPAPEKKAKKITDELQQQYFENIFHITSVEELDKTIPPVQAPYNIKRKEQVIIERFIKEEPQIKPQSSDKLDNENKAKKSSEDRDELVTETLAGIYSDQMLYHKAISSYKKLMLRFPEKSRYFADKIEQLEKKTN